MTIRVSWALMGKPLRDLEAEVGWCEAAGLDGVWYSDYQGPADAEHGWPELSVVLAMLAQRTRRLFVGSLVTDVLRRHPMVVAGLFATLSHLAPGRVILGLGAGGGTSHFPFGIEMDAPAPRLREGIRVIRALWDADSRLPASFTGRFFTLRRAVLPIRPAHPVPIYVAACGPRMRALAAAKADGWIPEAHTPGTYARTLTEMKDVRAAARAVRPWEPCVALLFYPVRTDAEGRARLLRAAKVMLAFNVDVLRTLLPGAVPDGVRSLDLARDPKLWKSIQGAIPDDVAEQTILMGSPGTCRMRLQEYVQAGCRHVVLEPYWWMTPQRLHESIEAAAIIRTDLQAVAS